MRLCLGQKRAREMWFLARMYDAQQALQMGLVNTVVPLDQLETETLVWYVVLLAAVTVLPLVMAGVCSRAGLLCVAASCQAADHQ